MLDWITHRIAGTPARLVRSGLAGFLAGTAALLLVAIVRFAGGAGPLPDWAVADSPEALTAATLLVAWGVWAMGAGWRRAQARAVPSRARH